MQKDKVLMTVPETMQYLGLGRDTVLRLLHEEDFGLVIGRRTYANRFLLDRWLENRCKKNYRGCK